MVTKSTKITKYYQLSSIYILCIMGYDLLINGNIVECIYWEIDELLQSII